MSKVGTVEWARERLRETIGDLPECVLRALDFAAKAHAGQKRDVQPGLEPTPYLSHPVEVAVLCYTLRQEAGVALPTFDVLTCAALLHDTIEDCDLPVGELERCFDAEVSDLVIALTKPRLRKDETTSERMSRFCRQIQAAGAPAVYIKSCDLLHNVAEHNTTPAEVLQRAVTKGVEHYAPMLKAFPFSVSFCQRIKAALDDAAAVCERSVLQAEPAAYLRLHRVLEAARAKKTEVHDAVELLGQTFKTKEVAVLLFSRHMRPQVVAGQVSLPTDTGRLEMIRRIARERGGFTGLKASIFKTSTYHIPPGFTYFACSENGFDGSDVVIVCGIPGDWRKKAESGLAPEAFMRLILSAVLSQRAARHRELATEALRLGMQIELSSALELNIHPCELERLARWRYACEAACEIVAGKLRGFVHLAGLRTTLWRRVRVESRLKAISSIVEKFSRRAELRWPKFEMMTDIAGVRVITLAAWQAEELSEFMRTADGLRSSGWQRFDLHPTREGYRGVHGVVEVAIPGQEHIVPCEVQLRTVLQDAWATLSHAVAYKEAQGDFYIPELQKLSRSLAECDETISSILSQHERRSGEA